MNPLCLRLEKEVANNARNRLLGNVHNNHHILKDHVCIDQKSIILYLPIDTSPLNLIRYIILLNVIEPITLPGKHLILTTYICIYILHFKLSIHLYYLKIQKNFKM